MRDSSRWREEGYSIRFHGPDAEQLGKRGGARSLVACCDAACYIGWNISTLRQRPRLLDAVHVSSNVTPCRAASKSCIESEFRLSSRLIPRVSLIESLRLRDIRNRGLPSSPSIYTCTRRFSSTRTSCSLSYIEHVAVRDSKPRSNVTIGLPLAVDRWRIFWSFVARVEASELIFLARPRNEMFDGSFFRNSMLVFSPWESRLFISSLGRNENIAKVRKGSV